MGRVALGERGTGAAVAVGVAARREETAKKTIMVATQARRKVDP
jgi:hypothetical protein